MIHLSLTKTLSDGSQEDLKFQVPTEIHEIPYSHTIQYQLLFHDLSGWMRDFVQLSTEEQQIQQRSWNETQWEEYVILMGRILGIFTDLNFDDLREIPFIPDPTNPWNSILVLVGQITSIINSYKEKPREQFKHKGHTYVVPSAETYIIAGFEQKTWGPGMKLGEVIESLQRSHIFSAKDEQGNYLIEDAKYQSIISIIASICRRVEKDGTLEEIPLGIGPFSEFVTRRAKELEDLPTDVCQDVGFFLTSSWTRSIRTRMQNQRSGKPTPRTRPRLTSSDNSKKRGRPGVGILSFINWRRKTRSRNQD